MLSWRRVRLALISLAKTNLERDIWTKEGRK